MFYANSVQKEHIMKRLAEKDLQRWYTRSRRKPLVIRGARQVGKSTLVRQFAEEQRLRLYEVNLERHRKLDSVFSSGNTEDILQELAYVCGMGKLDGKQGLLFLDEIQATPHAIPFLRYFYEDIPELPVIAAGSLLEFTLAKHHFSMPVGRIEYLFLGPMSFYEYLLARRETDLCELMTSFSWEVFPLAAHDRLLRHLRNFLLIGGMPEAVLAAIESGDPEEISDVHSSIIETYVDDFGKYARESQLTRLQTVFHHVPSNTGKKLIYSHIDPHASARELKPAVDLLIKAGVILPAHHCTANGLPLRAEMNRRVVKLFFLDVGLMNHVCGLHHIALGDMCHRRFVNEGALAEQMIAQHLLHAGRRNVTPELNYWLREGRSSNAEVDFLAVSNGRILPVEVKAGKAGTLKSLHRFIHDKQQGLAVRLDLNLPSQQTVDMRFRLGTSSEHVQYNLLSLPLYMVEQLPRLLEDEGGGR